ncbi:MAG TPA: hypothetical protein ENK81_03655, partial [Euryarchaeota archaeon]|nr:hypothetical protein [Euryarchaeota archaeon]
DYRAPKLLLSLEILQKISECDSKGKKVYIHCVGGLGRSGALAAAYLVYKHGLKPEEAIKEVRKIRPGSVQSEEQQLFVRRVYNALFGVERDKISKAASKVRENLEEETFRQLNKRTEISLDLVWGLFRKESLGPITFISSLAYSKALSGYLRGLSLSAYNIFSKESNNDGHQEREMVEVIIEFSSEVAKIMGDGIAYFKVDPQPEEATIIGYCLTYCEDTLNTIFKKYKSAMEKGLGKNIEIVADYVW